MIRYGLDKFSSHQSPVDPSGGLRLSRVASLAKGTNRSFFAPKNIVAYFSGVYHLFRGELSARTTPVVLGRCLVR